MRSIMSSWCVGRAAAASACSIDIGSRITPERLTWNGTWTAGEPPYFSFGRVPDPYLPRGRD
jgi:hypothetical protein